MSEMATIRLLNYPLRLAARSRQHGEELIREFQLLELDPEPDGRLPLPTRLQELVARVTSDYRAQVDQLDALRAPAMARGDASMDLVYDVPVAARSAVEELIDIFAECDEFCRQGEHLLTLAAPPDIVAFRHWNFTETLRQIDGEPPIPWDGPLG